VIEHEPFAANRRPFDLHAAATGNEEESFVLTGRVIGQVDQAVFDVCQFKYAARIEAAALDAGQKNGK